MLAEAPVIFPLSAWLVFVVFLMASAAVVPLGAWLLRRGLPPECRVPIRLDPVVFGTSQKALRSPRQAVLQHRTLMTAVFVAVLVVCLLPGMVALRRLGIPGLQVAIGLVLPTLLVALHAHQRGEVR